MSSYIPFRLRQIKDDDIKNGIAKELERAAAQEVEMDRSDVIRAALRFYFKHKNNLPKSSGAGAPTHHHESPAHQGIETTHIDQQRTPLRDSIQEPPTQQKEAVKNPTAPYLAKSKLRRY